MGIISTEVLIQQGLTADSEESVSYKILSNFTKKSVELRSFLVTLHRQRGFLPALISPQPKPDAMQVDEGAPAEKQHLDLSMTKRLFSQLNGDLTPSAADFQREFDILLTSERKMASILLGALKSVTDQQ